MISILVVPKSMLVNKKLQWQSLPLACTSSTHCQLIINKAYLITNKTYDFLSCLQPSRVQISNVTYRNIWGNSGSKVAVTFRCSQSRPCRDLVMENINLHYHGRDGEGSTAICNNVKGESLGPQNPASCI